MPTPDASTRLAAAVARALEWHAGQTRKGTSIPYSSHLLQVAGSVLEYGGDPDQAIAAVLHDSIEDCPDVDETRISAEFGEAVGALVRDCSEPNATDASGAKRPWKARKADYLEMLERVSDRALLIAACDKRHNLDALVRDLRELGPATLDRFNAGPADQRWFFERFLDLAAGRIPGELRRELQRLVREFGALTGA